MARRATVRLIKRGEIVRCPCVRCGAVAVETHHTDYADPRAVEFLCRRCHRALHRRPVNPETGNAAMDALRRGLAAAMGRRTHAEVAAMLGVSQPTVTRFLHGVRTPIRLNFLGAIVRAYPNLRELVDRVLHGENAGADDLAPIAAS
jgi:hypothetical protein